MTTTPLTFAVLADRYGRAVAYLASLDRNPVPSDPTAADAATLVQLVIDAADFLIQDHSFEQAGLLTAAASHLANALKAGDDDRPGLLRQAEEKLGFIGDITPDLRAHADELGIAWAF
ncbi:hypothetical protein ACIOJE_37970 [Kitasatospora sp. NPDC087861]|uniref:hypothetical protein n=1 Tax=Kitasatospora sp. NPDC087861 TaxID=3364070 RepID=UPI0038250A30